MEIPQLTKVYKVEFFNPADILLRKHDERKKLRLPSDTRRPFLVTERELGYYSKFGDGYLNVEYVGDMYFPPLASNMELEYVDNIYYPRFIAED